MPLTYVPLHPIAVSQTSSLSCSWKIRRVSCLRNLLGITKVDKEKNQCIRGKTGAQNMVEEIKQYQEKWLQHIQRMDTNRIPKQALQYKPSVQHQCLGYTSQSYNQCLGCVGWMSVVQSVSGMCGLNVRRNISVWDVWVEYPSYNQCLGCVGCMTVGQSVSGMFGLNVRRNISVWDVWVECPS